MSASLSGDDPEKFLKIYETAKVCEVIYLYSRKLKVENQRSTEQIRRNLMMMDWNAKILTGEDTKLLEKFDQDQAVGNRQEATEKARGNREGKSDEQDLEKRLEKERKIEEQLNSFGIKTITK